MSTYLVRMKEDKQIFGIIWADNLVELGWIIDEDLDPYSCEYKKLSNGGIYWSNFVEVKLPLNKSNDDNGIEIVMKKLGHPELFDNFYFALFEKHGWKKFDVPLDDFYGFPNK